MKMNSSNSNKGEQNPTPQTDQYTIPDYEAGVKAGMLMAYEYWLYDLEINHPLNLPTAYIETLKLRLEAMIRKLKSPQQDTRSTQTPPKSQQKNARKQPKLEQTKEKS